jgi:membrane protease YdiL (CAAX protease family)
MLGLVIRCYLALLAVQVVAIIYVKLDGDVLTAVVADTIGIAAIAIGVALRHRALVTPAYHTVGWSWRGYALVLLAAPVVLAAVIGYVRGLTAVFGLQGWRQLGELEGHSQTLLVAVIAIAPALYEELAFRGLIFGALRESFSTREAIFISAFAFALLHLSLPSLVTHLPLGLYFGWLRYRSGSMWPSTFAHFCHNLGVIIADACGWT